MVTSTITALPLILKIVALTLRIQAVQQPFQPDKSFVTLFAGTTMQKARQALRAGFTG